MPRDRPILPEVGPLGHLTDREFAAASEQQHDLLTGGAGQCPEELVGGRSELQGVGCAVWPEAPPGDRSVLHPGIEECRAWWGRSDALDRKLYFWQIGRFIGDADARHELIPLLYSQFLQARPAFWALNDTLLRAVVARQKMGPETRAFERPVRVVFGEGDPWMNPGVAAHFHELFPRSELILLRGAYHYVQVDEPAEVARLLLYPSESSIGMAPDAGLAMRPAASSPRARSRREAPRQPRG